MLFGSYVWSPKSYVLYLFSSMLFLFGKRQMAATVVNEVML